MPELPEVELARRLAARVGRGRRIVGVTAARDPIVFEGRSPADLRRALLGRHIEGTRRKGKHFWLELDVRPWPVLRLRDDRGPPRTGPPGPAPALGPRGRAGRLAAPVPQAAPRPRRRGRPGLRRRPPAGPGPPPPDRRRAPGQRAGLRRADRAALSRPPSGLAWPPTEPPSRPSSSTRASRPALATGSPTTSSTARASTPGGPRPACRPRRASGCGGLSATSWGPRSGWGATATGTPATGCSTSGGSTSRAAARPPSPAAASGSASPPSGAAPPPGRRPASGEKEIRQPWPVERPHMRSAAPCHHEILG